MSAGMMCLDCRRYMEGTLEQRCPCVYPKPSEDAKTQISKDRCAICGIGQSPPPPGPPPIPGQYYCLKHRHHKQRTQFA